MCLTITIYGVFENIFSAVYISYFFSFIAFPVGSEVKASACNAGVTGDTGLIPGLGDPLEKEMATHSNILAWEIPWPEEPGWLQSMGSQSRT